MEILGLDNAAPDPRPSSSTVDSEIEAAAARKDRDAVAKLLLDAHAPALGRVCMALLGSQAEAESALQETLTEALETLTHRRAERSLRAWLSSIARRRCALRADARPAVLPAGESAEPAQRARSLLAELRPTEREALVLRFGAELGFSEVGEACGVDEAAARQRASRGLARLRGLLGEVER